MNERIKELATRAVENSLFEPIQPAITIGEGTSKMEIPLIFTEKFAELIVTECGRYLDSPEFIGRRDLDWTMVLNEHFGIK